MLCGVTISDREILTVRQRPNGLNLDSFALASSLAGIANNKGTISTMKLTIALCLIASTTAFAPLAQTTRYVGKCFANEGRSIGFLKCQIQYLTHYPFSYRTSLKLQATVDNEEKKFSKRKIAKKVRTNISKTRLVVVASPNKISVFTSAPRRLLTFQIYSNLESG